MQHTVTSSTKSSLLLATSTSAPDCTTSSADTMRANVGAPACAMLLRTTLTSVASVGSPLISDLRFPSVVSESDGTDHDGLRSFKFWWYLGLTLGAGINSWWKCPRLNSGPSCARQIPSSHSFSSKD